MEAEAPSYNIESLRRMIETFGERIEVATVSELSEREAIFVEDGNHGENRPRQDEFAPTGIAFLRPPDLKDGRVDFQSCSRINDAGFKRVRKGIGRRGDIILTHRATVGRIAITDDDAPEVFVTNPGTTIWRSTDPNVLDQRFLYCFMRSAAFMDQLWSQVGNNSTFDYVSLTQQRGLRVAYPPIAEQKAIAAVLGALDDKIELNRRMNATLESMARALFQSWFVDFDPVRAKLDGREPVGLDQATAELFPDSFQDSVIGHIPHGWTVGMLNDLTRFVIGGDWGATEPTEDQFVSCYCVRGADIPSLQGGGIGKMPTRFLKPSSVEKRNLADGDLAIEISGGSPTQCTGRPVLVSNALLQSLGQPLVASSFCRIVKLKSPALSKFAYLWLRRLYEAGELFQFETGTTGIKNFAFVIFSERYPLVVPDLRVAEAFDCAVSPFFARIQENSQESRALATLRDTLLPKLLSGELSVGGLNQIMEFAA
jgi:type I restriction enzyme, S subunit